MATKAQIMGGLTIIAQYVEDDDHCFIRADHDQIWAGYDDGSMTAEHRAEIKQLGWFFDNDGWSHFV